MDPGRKDPALAELVQGDHPVWVGGGEPTLRGDLPELLETLGDRLQGLCTDGWALARPQVVADLQNRGLSAVRIPFHSATASAHDWLAGTPGAHKLAWQALRTCVEAGLEVDAEVVVTRPTLLHLDSTIGVLARLNLHGIVLRSLDGDTPDFPALAARWPLVRGPLERALVIAGQAGRTIWLEGIPTCAVEAQDALRTPGRPQDGRPCASCAGPPDCSGIPPAYLAAFGWQDLPRGPSRTDVVTVAILPDEATRTARHRLVEAATTEATTLRLLGLDHPEGADLLAEALALSFQRVEACGLLHMVANWSTRQRLRLKNLDRLDGLWHGEDAAQHDAAVGETGAWDAGWALLAELAAHEVEVPSWPDRFRFLRDQASLPQAVPGLPPCLRPLGWQRALESSPNPPPPPAAIPCEHKASCAEGEACPGLAPGLDPLGIAPL